jgi:hypothetical protein
MTAPEFIERIGHRAFYRPIADVDFEQALDMIGAAMSWAREQKLADMVLNALSLKGIPPLTTYMRYAAIMRWAECAPALRIAWVVTPQTIDPQRFGMLVAHNRGMNGEIFSTEAAALAWLDARPRRDPPTT